MVNIENSDQDYSYTFIKQQMVKSIAVLGVRRIVYQIILTSSNIILARLLTPQIFGAFAIISFVILNIGILTNLGLAQAYIQNKDALSFRDYRSFFTSVVLTSLLFIGVMYILSPYIISFYGENLGTGEVFWLRLYAFYILFSNISSVSIVILERALAYTKLAVVEIIVLFLTQITIVLFAINGWGMGSFVIGNIFGSMVSVILFFLAAPWKFGIFLSLERLKKYLQFGINYQLGTLTGALNASVIPLFVGSVSGPAAVGFINMAGGVRQAALAPVETISKLGFTVGARIQKKPEILSRLVERMIDVSALFSFPLLSIIFALTPQLVVIVFTKSWEPMIVTLYLSLIQGIFLLYNIIIIQILLALGHARIVRNISLFQAILQWVLTIPLVMLLGFNGVVVAGIFVSLTNIIALLYLKKQLKFNLFSRTFPYMAYAGVSGSFVYILSKRIAVDTIYSLIFLGVAGLCIYCLQVGIFSKKRLVSDLLSIQALIS